jgi:exodeoxyribonuclease V gamma subunit
VLHVVTADRPQPLATALAAVLREPPPDPFDRDWVAVPTEGMRRWLQLELASTLGASSARTPDGIAANIEMPFPGALAQRVLAAGRPADAIDPWRVDHLVWAVLDMLAARRDDDQLGPAAQLPAGATWFGRARRLADLFDRYATHRPEMIRAWADGLDVGPAPTTGDDALFPALGAAQRWQPRLWRLVRERIGEPSPPERWPELLGEVRAGTVAVDLPARAAVFGMTTLPGGEAFLELAEALGAVRDLHLFLLDPSPAATTRVRAAAAAGAAPGAADPSDVVEHPLVRSWSRPHREATILLRRAERHGFPTTVAVDPPVADSTAAPAPPSLLARLQADIRADRAPGGDLTLDAHDRTVQIHACHGPARQVEVLRDAILHQLAADPTLREDDVVVLCPSIADYAPLVEAAFGPPADGGPARRDVEETAPRLAYRITDRSLRDAPPLLGALAALLDLLSGRFSASEVIDFVALPPVRARYGLDDDALGTISTWIGEANVRWGLDGLHRRQWNVPADLEANTWRAGLDRVLMGVVASDDDLDLTPGDIAPLGVEGSDIPVAGALADIVARLAGLADEAERERTMSEWCGLLVDACSGLFAVGAEHSGQWQLLRRILTRLSDEAVVAEKPSDAALTLGDVRSLLGQRLHGGGGRSHFFRGGVTVTSLLPLRWVPFRVVCVLGLDEGALAATPADGDDLGALAPRLGDRDPRADARQALLEAVLAAGDTLIVTRTGADVRTNHAVPPSVALAELRGAVVAMTAPGDRRRAEELLETHHPRQAFDERNLATTAGNGERPWSFDPRALAAARARRQREHDDGTPTPFLDRPLPAARDDVIALADLHSFLSDPVKHFLRNRLRLRLPRDDEPVADDFSLDLAQLRGWKAATRLLDARLAGRSRDEWERHERALGTIPPGVLGTKALDELAERVEGLLDAVSERGLDAAAVDPFPVDVELPDGTRLVGTVGIVEGARPGPVTITCSRAKAKQHIAAWLDLAALAAQHPDRSWRAVVVRRGKDKADVLELVPRAGDPVQRRHEAIRALEVAVDCYRRGTSEPVPLFPELSCELHRGKAQSKTWRDRYNGWGDGDDDAHVLVFGDIDLRELRAVHARVDDPPGDAPGRAQRFAAHLWSAVDQFACRRDDEEGS